MAALDMPGTEEDAAIAGELRVEMQRHHPAQPHYQRNSLTRARLLTTEPARSRC
jgi:hypothetical protein